MAKKETYPNYSVYLQMGGQLKKPYNASNRVKIDNLDEARRCMANCWNKYNGKVDVVLLRYDSLYDATIVQFINKQ